MTTVAPTWYPEVDCVTQSSAYLVTVLGGKADHGFAYSSGSVWHGTDQQAHFCLIAFVVGGDA